MSTLLRNGSGPSWGKVLEGSVVSVIFLDSESHMLDDAESMVDASQSRRLARR